MFPGVRERINGMKSVNVLNVLLIVFKLNRITPSAYKMIKTC